MHDIVNTEPDEKSVPSPTSKNPIIAPEAKESGIEAGKESSTEARKESE